VTLAFLAVLFVSGLQTLVSPGLVRNLEPFYYLIALQDVPGAALLALVVLAGLFVPLEVADIERACLGLSRHVRWVAAGFGVLCALASVLAYRAFPLSIDEFAACFQARLFASGQLFAHFGDKLVAWLTFPPFLDYFFIYQPDGGRVASSYMPGFALLLTPFMAAHVPWLLNPLLAAGSLLLIHRITLLIFEDEQTAGFSVLFAVASPAFFGHAISLYSMTAHLFLNLLFAWLLLRPSLARSALAGFAGSWALALHNPFPHFLFAVPWLLWVLRRERRWAHVGALAAGYLPLTALLVGGWMLLHARASSELHAATSTQSWLGHLLGAFDVRSFLGVARIRLLGLAKLVAWAVPGLVPFAVLGASRERAHVAVRLLAWSCLLTFFGYFAVSFTQSHGWGYRYFHSAWGALPILAAAALRARGTDATPAAHTRLLQTAFAWALLSVTLMNGARLYQISDFMQGHLAQRPPVPDDGRAYFTFLKPQFGFHVEDLIQNDPLLRDDHVYLMSHGATDAAFLRRYAPSAVPVSESKTGATFAVSHAELEAFRRAALGAGEPGAKQ
jgi:hypothetical protein